MRCKDVHFDYEKQLEQFIERGVKIKNRKEALHHLKHLSYYKIKELAAFFRLSNGLYEKGTYFETIIQNFYYDKNLRMEFLKCSEKIELSIKARICYILGAKYGAFGYLRFSNWCDRTIPKDLVIREEENFKRKILKKMSVFSNNKLVQEFITENPNEKYLSIWRVSEVLTFGEILSLFNLMSHNNKIAIVKNYNLSIEDFISHLNSIKLMRNFCAHNMAIINLKIRTIPRIKANFQYLLTDPQKIITPILIMVSFIKIINPNYNFKELYHIFFQLTEKIHPNTFGLTNLDDFKKFLFF